MKINNIKILTLGLALVALAACKDEHPFNGGVDPTQPETVTGQITGAAFNLTVKSLDFVTKSEPEEYLDDFTIDIFNKNNTETPYKSYIYKNIPEVISLPVGTYYVQASYGDNTIEAAFNNPYYIGTSQDIVIEEGKIVDAVEIECTLGNIKVSVTFDDELKAQMGEGSKVTVHVGDSDKELEFYPDSEEGYFRYSQGSNTLAAVFTGTLQGEPIVEQKTYNDVAAGNFYNITFKLHNVEPTPQHEPEPDQSTDEGNQSTTTEPETSNGTLKIDATVIFSSDAEAVDGNLNPDSENYLKDNMRPGNESDEEEDGWYDGSGNSGNSGNTGNSGNENPGNNQGGNEPSKPASVKPSLVSDDVDLNTVTDISNWPENKSLAVKILTPTKLTKFVCTIDSDLLTEEALEGVKLKKNLDLINDIYDKEPGKSESELWKSLRGLGFPVGTDVTNPNEYVDGNYVITFEISAQFVGLLKGLGSGYYNFIFQLENEAGATTATLKLKS